MGAWKYYSDEAKRWNELLKGTVPPSREAAQVAIRKTCKHLKMSAPQITFTTGYRRSYANYYRVVLHAGVMDWLLVAHELAHYIAFHHEDRDYSKRARHHGEYHKAQTNWLLMQWKKWGWLDGKLDDAIKAKAAKKAAKAAEKEKRKAGRDAALATPHARILKRKIQIERLDEKIRKHEAQIKRLKTMQGRARRSIAMLERSVNS